MAISVRELAAGMHAFEMLFIRSAIGVAILVVVLWVGGAWQNLRTKRIGGHVLRNVVHFVGQTLWIFGIALLPLATVSAIEFTTPVWGGRARRRLFGGAHAPGALGSSRPRLSPASW